MNNQPPPVSSDGRGLIGMAILGLAALLYFGLPSVLGGWPPSYVRVGPVELGALVETTCHGARVNGETVIEVCK